MSEMSRKARKENRAKAQRLVGTDPHKKVDASSWTPSEPLNAGVKTGARPVRARIYKNGGKVQGDRARRADKLPRDIANAASTRNTVGANKKAFGSAHEGGYKKGGRTKKDIGGPAGMQQVDPRLGVVSPNRMAFGPTNGRMFGMKNGGEAKKANYLGGTRPTGGRIAKANGGPSYSKTAVDKEIAKDKRIKPGEARNIHRLLRGRTDAPYNPPRDPAPKMTDDARYWVENGQEKPDGQKRGGRAKCAGGRTMRASGGRTEDEGYFSGAPATAPDKHIIRALKEHGNSHRYINGVLHGVGTAIKDGKSFEDVQPIGNSTKKLRDFLGYEKGGRVGRAEGGRTKAKGKTNINITIGQPNQQQPPMMPPQGVVRPPPVPPQMPMGGPPGGGGMPPPGLAGGAGPGPMIPPQSMGGPPPGGMPRARGGRTSADMTAGAMSGEGRLEKSDIQRSNRRAGGKVYRSAKDMDAGSLSGLGRLEKSEIQSRNR